MKKCKKGKHRYSVWKQYFPNRSLTVKCLNCGKFIDYTKEWLALKEGERIKIELDGVIESGMNVVDPTDVEDILTGKKELD